MLREYAYKGIFKHAQVSRDGNNDTGRHGNLYAGGISCVRFFSHAQLGNYPPVVMACV
jgi:hypothetical protein